MSEDLSGTFGLLEDALTSADEDRTNLDKEWKKARQNGTQLRKHVYAPFDALNPKHKIPFEFRESDKFIAIWDRTDEALGNTVLMVMPPTTFEETPALTMPEPRSPTMATPTPIIINPPQNTAPAKQASRGFWGGLWDYNIAKKEIEKRIRGERPVITTERIVYDPKDVVYQLIPSLNQIKSEYFRYLRRHLSYGNNPSRRWCQLGHEVLQEEMSKYFNVVFPFCYASIQHQKEKVRRDKLIMSGHVARIATAQAEAQAFQQMYFPPDVKAMLRAMQEGRGFHPDGRKMDSSSSGADKVARQMRERRQH